MTGEAREVPEASEVLDRMTDAFFALDDRWRFTYLNERARALVCRAAASEPTTEELRGRRIWDVVPAAEESVFAEQYQEAVETGESVSFEAEYEPIDTWFEVRAHPSESGLSVYFRDVTERKRQEQQRERDATALRSLYRIAADRDSSFDEKVDQVLRLGCEYLDIPYGMVNELDEDGQTVAYAHGTPDGLRPGQSMPRDEAYCKETVETDDLLAIVDAVEDGWGDDPAYAEHGLGCYIGGRIEVDDDVDRTLCFAGPDPRQTSFTETEETIVELLTQWLTFEFTRRADRRALEQKNERLENLASVVSHDLRNPLTIAKARTEFMADDAPDEHVEAVADSLDRIESLIDDLTMLARQGDIIDERRTVDLSAVATDAWGAVPTEGTGATLECEGDLSLYADRSRLQQVLENLFKNSVEHGSTSSRTQSDDSVEHGSTGSRTQSGDSVEHGSTSSRTQSDDSVEHGASEDGVTVRVGPTADGFLVADDGPGIPEDEREKVLRMGYTTEDDGSGIGMAIVREVVSAHGWSISVGESASGGARFDVTGVEPVD
ncbi:sensor histidine kinase [Haloglomus salinum]|uniref:sensor histidine kinase n=1 Tax=Haloglomus salinum TaxID=2962673 RepID=UPI0020C9B5E8|nr:ATP-binding protein [Haloglomus salinum]